MFKRLHATQMRADSELPTEFDVEYYRKRYPDLKNLTERELENHYLSCGIRDGRQGSPAAKRPRKATASAEDALPVCSSVQAGAPAEAASAAAEAGSQPIPLRSM